MLEVNENQIERLEELLDGEMRDDEAEALRARIACEPGLAAAFEQLRADREVRRRAWRALEPADEQVVALVSSVRSAVRKDELWSRRARALRYVSGLAACIVLGFVFGRFVPLGSSATRDRGTGIIFENPTNGTMEVMNNRTPRAGPPGGFKVLLTDNYGNVLGEQRFNSFDEAREFTKDLGRMQKPNPQPLRNPGNDVMLIKGEF